MVCLLGTALKVEAQSVCSHLTNLAQDATVRAQCAAAAAAASGDFWALEGSFERDLSLGYCSSAQGEQSLAH